MRPVVYFPELRLGEQAVQAHAAIGLAAEQPQKSVDSATDEALRAEAAKRPRLVRRRREIQTCVIEA